MRYLLTSLLFLIIASISTQQPLAASKLPYAGIQTAVITAIPDKKKSCNCQINTAHCNMTSDALASKSGKSYINDRKNNNISPCVFAQLMGNPLDIPIPPPKMI